MPDEAGQQLRRIAPTQTRDRGTRDRRRNLGAIIRYLIIISGGAGVAGMTFYGLKYLGY